MGNAMTNVRIAARKSPRIRVVRLDARVRWREGASVLAGTGGSDRPGSGSRRPGARKILAESWATLRRTIACRSNVDADSVSNALSVL